jgi:hypothetical protein
MVWIVGGDSQVAEMILWSLALGGLPYTSLGFPVSSGLKVIMSPLCRPTAICLPFGDQDTTY